jgi:hypothetical protein
MHICVFPSPCLFTIHLSTSFGVVQEEQLKNLHNYSVINDDLSEADDVSASCVRQKGENMVVI